jgi:hypothetical protein
MLAFPVALLCVLKTLTNDPGHGPDTLYVSDPLMTTHNRLMHLPQSPASTLEYSRVPAMVRGVWGLHKDVPEVVADRSGQGVPRGDAVEEPRA